MMRAKLELYLKFPKNFTRYLLELARQGPVMSFCGNSIFDFISFQKNIVVNGSLICIYFL